jgi:hypothetical protein
MANNALGRALGNVTPSNETRKGAGAHESVNNAGTQRDGTPTNIGAKPTNPGSTFFKSRPDKSPASGMEKLKFK